MEGPAEGGTVRRRPEFVSSASQEFNLIARVLARSLVRFMDDATSEDWSAIAAGHASRPVTLNEGRNATVTAKRVFGVIFDRCEKDPYAVIDLIARDREVLEEAQRGQGRKLQHQLRPEPLDASELELDQESKSEPTNVLPSFTLGFVNRCQLLVGPVCRRHGFGGRSGGRYSSHLYGAPPPRYQARGFEPRNACTHRHVPLRWGAAPSATGAQYM